MAKTNQFPVLTASYKIVWAVNTPQGVKQAVAPTGLKNYTGLPKSKTLVAVVVIQKSVTSFHSLKFTIDGAISHRDREEPIETIKTDLNNLMRIPAWIAMQEACQENSMYFWSLSWMGVQCEKCEKVFSVSGLAQTQDKFEFLCRDCAAFSAF